MSRNFINGTETASNGWPVFPNIQLERDRQERRNNDIDYHANQAKMKSAELVIEMAYNRGVKEATDNYINSSMNIYKGYYKSLSEKLDKVEEEVHELNTKMDIIIKHALDK